MKLAAFIIAGLAFFIIAAWMVAVPEQLILDVADSALGGTPVAIRPEGFRKAPLFGFSAEKAAILRRQGRQPLAVFGPVSGRISLLSILELRPGLDLEGKAGAGVVKGRVGLTREKEIEINGEGIPLQAIPALTEAGIQGDGTLSFKLRSAGGRSEVQLKIQDARLKDVVMEGAFLPLSLARTAQGSIVLEKDVLNVKSVTLEGSGVHARLTGSVKGSSMDLDLELSVDATFRSGAAILALLESYRVSPGNYRIPVRTGVRR